MNDFKSAAIEQTNILTGTLGDDLLVGNPNENFIWGKAGNDTLEGNGGNDLLKGNRGDDSLLGGEGNDLLFGGKDNDTLSGDLGDDTLFGNSGDDLIQDDEGSNLLNGGRGNDRLIGGKPKPRSVGDPFPSFGDIDDDLYGGAGNDTLDGGEGFDRLTGGNGTDIFILSNPGTGYDRITDFQDGIDKIQVPGILFFQELFISRTFIAVGGSPESFITVENNGTILGVFPSLDSPDELTIDDFVGLENRPEGQNIVGTIGDDFLVGGAGSDTIESLEGNDTIDGGRGNDLLISRGGGRDTFIIRRGDGFDDLIDYRPGEDKLLLVDGLTRDDIIVESGDIDDVDFVTIRDAVTGDALADISTIFSLSEFNESDIIVADS